MCTKMTAGAGRVDGSNHVAASVRPSSVLKVTFWDRTPATGIWSRVTTAAATSHGARLRRHGLWSVEAEVL